MTLTAYQNLTVKDLIEKLKNYPENLPIASNFDAQRYTSGELATCLDMDVVTWEATNYPYEREPFKYLNIGY